VKRIILILVLLAVAALVWWRAAPYLGDILGYGTESEDLGEPTGEFVAPTQSPNSEYDPDEPIRENSAPASARESKEELVARILKERYPDPKFPPFDEVAATWGSQTPESVLPDRVRLADAVVLREINGASLLGISSIKAGGEAQPLRVTGSQLTIASLGHSSIQGEVPVAKTDLQNGIRRRYEARCEAIFDRVDAMRERAAQRLPLLHTLKERFADGPWHDSDDPVFEIVKASIRAGAAGPVSVGDVKHIFDDSFVRFESGKLANGNFQTFTVYFELDGAFGPAPWESLAVQTGRDTIIWLEPVPEL
jgi:hypothetical protein